jgi:hypothetical protein
MLQTDKAQTDKAQNDKASTDNPSRERILERIRAGLRTSVPAANVTALDRVIFEPVVNPLERFQQECVSNLMECALTADCAASARQLSEVLESLPDGEIFLVGHL